MITSSPTGIGRQQRTFGGCPILPGCIIFPSDCVFGTLADTLVRGRRRARLRVLLLSAIAVEADFQPDGPVQLDHSWFVVRALRRAPYPMRLPDDHM